MARGLTAAAVERFKPDPSKRLEVPDGLLPDLYFVIQPSGARSWAVHRHTAKPKADACPYPARTCDCPRPSARGSSSPSPLAAILGPKSGRPDRPHGSRSPTVTCLQA